MPKWRNWHTRNIQNVVVFDRVGPNPTLGIIKLGCN